MGLGKAVRSCRCLMGCCVLYEFLKMEIELGALVINC